MAKEKRTFVNILPLGSPMTVLCCHLTMPEHQKTLSELKETSLIIHLKKGRVTPSVTLSPVLKTLSTHLPVHSVQGTTPTLPSVFSANMAQLRVSHPGTDSGLHIPGMFRLLLYSNACFILNFTWISKLLSAGKIMTTCFSE